MKRLLTEPLLHFLVLGAALFGLYGLVGKNERGQRPTIVVSAAQIENLSNGFARVWQRLPTAQELAGLIEDHIRSEVYYRQAKSLGLDRDDIVIRRRLQLKMEVMAEGGTAAAEPSDEALKEYLAAQPDKFRSEDLLSFRHVFLSASRRAAPSDDAEQMAAKLANGEVIDLEGIGDPFLLGNAFRAMTPSDVSRNFGDGFAARLVGLEPGRWQGPIASGYGLHFVFVDERTSGTVPPLEAVRQAVNRELLNARRVEAQEKLYRALRDHYDITVEALPVAPTPRSGSAR